jgi:DNA-binding response OmpR family regulator
MNSSEDTRAAVLVVGLDARAGDELAARLSADGFQARHAASRQHAAALARHSRPQLLILAGADDHCAGALTLLGEIRRATSDAPWDRSSGVIVLGPPDEAELLRAFERGADDFLAAPAGYLELRARLGALARRAQERRLRCHDRVLTGGLELDRLRRSASLGGHPLALSRLEFELLAALAAEPERVFTKAELLREVWGFHLAARTRTLDSHACRLRRKLSDAGDAGWVANVWGVGYRLRGEAAGG